MTHSALLRLCAASALIALLVPAAWANGLTGEQEAWSALNDGRYPLSLSADGKWLAYVDAQNILHRQRVDDKKNHQRLDLGVGVNGLAISRSGDKAVFISQTGCLGSVAFTATKSPAVKTTFRPHWTNWPYSDTGTSADCLTPRLDEPLFYNHTGLALSDDAKLAAIGLNPIRIIEVTSGREVQTIPATGTILHLGFLEDSRKLLVVLARLGERWEETSEASDMQFAVWDLRSKQLFNFHNTKTSGQLVLYDLLWAFSESTGDLWAINTQGHYWEKDPARPDTERRVSIQPYAVNLKQCASAPRPGPTLPAEEDNDGWLGFAADPYGRYLAGISPVRDTARKRAAATLWVRNARTGQILSEWRLDDEVRSLTPSPDGRVLYAVSAGQPPVEQLEYARYGNFKGGGQLLKFDLTPKLEQLPKVETKIWSEATCPLEDEQVDAREVSASKASIRRAFEIQLGENPMQAHCHNPMDAMEMPSAWGLSPDGTLLVDRDTRLEKIDPATGKVLQRLPTPRSQSVCSTPLYEWQQFISWEGDTITLRPFAEKLQTGDRKILVKKPGWLVENVSTLGDRIGVRWIDQRYAKDELNHEAGSALAIEYDLSGKQLKQTLGFASSGTAAFSEEDGEDAEELFPKPVAPQPGPYRWEKSYLDSVRAYKVDSAGKESTVFWVGLKLDQVQRHMFGESSVTNLGHALGANIGANGVNIYDASQRKELARINMEGVSNAVWHVQTRILLLESVHRTPEGGTARKLTGFRID